MVKETQMIARLKSSFSELFEDLYARGLIPSPICEICGQENETLEHVINDCTGYINERAFFYTIMMRFKFLRLIQRYKFNELVIGTPQLEQDLRKYNAKEIQNFYICTKNFIRKIDHMRKILLA